MDNLCMCKLCDHWENKGCYPACTSKFENFSMNMHDAKVRADAIDDVIKKLAESEDTILTDKQYYTLMEMKEQNNESNND